MWWMLAGAAIGAGVGFLNTALQRKNDRDAIDQHKDNALLQYEYGKTLGDRQFALQKGEALHQLGQQERSLHEGMGRFTDEYNTMLLSRAFGEQDARIQTASGIGASLVQEGMSGTRGSSSGQLMRDYAAQGLERQIAVQRQQDAHTLAGTVQGANSAIGAMQHERESWENGGWRYEQKAAQDAYNKNIADLGQNHFQWQLDQITANTGLDYTTGIFGGAASGMSAGNSMARYDRDWWGWNWGKGF